MKRLSFILACLIALGGCSNGGSNGTGGDSPPTPADSATSDGGAGDPTPGDPGPVGDPGGVGDATRGDAVGGDPSACSTCWRSALYPNDWTPSFTDSGGRFLHDFSYAGYHNGEAELPNTLIGTAYDVNDYGADDTGVADSCPAIQSAIAAAGAAGGGIVVLPAGLYRCDSTLTVSDDGVMLRGAGAATELFFTQSAGMTGKAHLTLRGNVQHGADLLLASDAANRDEVIELTDASSLAVGDAIAVGWVITAEFTADHGMTGVWTSFTDQWKPVFRRQVRAIDLTTTPHRVTLDVPLRYAASMRDQASVRAESGYLSEVGIDSLAISNAVSWSDAWTLNRVHVIELNGVRDAFVRNVRSFDSAFGEGEHHLMSGGIAVFGSKRVTVSGSRMEMAQHRGGGGNGYLFEVSRSNEVLFADCAGIDGRHNFIQNWDFGTSGCVFLRCESAGGVMLSSSTDTIGLPGWSEFHHSLAMGNLVDQCTLSDGWFGGNRLTESSGAGHTTTENVFWNTQGSGIITSMAYGNGYVIGPNTATVLTSMLLPQALGTSPQDWVERSPGSERLEPASLYEDQLRRRLR